MKDKQQINLESRIGKPIVSRHQATTAQFAMYVFIRQAPQSINPVVCRGVVRDSDSYRCFEIALKKNLRCANWNSELYGYYRGLRAGEDNDQNKKIGRLFYRIFLFFFWTLLNHLHWLYLYLRSVSPEQLNFNIFLESFKRVLHKEDKVITSFNITYIKNINIPFI